MKVEINESMILSAKRCYAKGDTMHDISDRTGIPIENLYNILSVLPRCEGCNKKIGKTQTYSNLGGLLYCVSCKPILP